MLDCSRMLPLLLTLLQEPSRIDQWIQEIPHPVIIAKVKVENGAYILPENLGDNRAILAQYFSQYEFRAQFVHTHAVNLNIDFPGRPPIHFIVLNMARMTDTKQPEEEIIAHELGHVALHAKGFRAPAYTPGLLACEPIHTGDIVQHAIIRRELSRRGFHPEKGWIQDLEQAWKQLEKSPPQTAPPADLCQRLQRLSLLIDLELGLSGENQWKNLQNYRDRLTAHDPLLAELASRLARLLNHLDLDNKIEYYAAVGAVRSASTLLIQQLVEKSAAPVVP